MYVSESIPRVHGPSDIFKEDNCQKDSKKGLSSLTVPE